ncbi:fibropellin-1-like [Haliotis asinina]|uniref:fibropellin-1-like n=1 Tax=Haliotis asinina TaxID=109174 RepID=UPI0035320987
MVREQLLVFIFGFTMVCGSGRLSLRLLSFNNPGGRGSNGNYCDGFSFLKHSACDHQFTICLNSVYGSMDLSQCQYGRAVTGEVRDQDRITFRTDIGGVRNPIVFRITSFPPKLRIKVGIWDVDSSNAHDFVDLLVKDTALNPSPTEAGSLPVRLLIRRRTALLVEMRSYCDPNYYGQQCAVFCSASTKGRYTCHPYTGAKICTPGWYGVNCEVNVDDCVSSPCQNGATCIDKHRGYICACPYGFTGERCETRINPCLSNPCSNGGLCEDTGRGYRCDCPIGWEGPRCAMDRDECLSQPCQHRGTCVDYPGAYECLCLNGFTGRLCDVNINDCLSNSCINNSTCVDGLNSYLCACAAGFTGRSCEVIINECLSNPCENNATCVDDVNGYSCTCAAGFTGTFCEENIDDCVDKPCVNNGVCMDDVNSYLCACAAGFTGRSCEVNINECSSNPCENNATCVDHVDGYRCSCASGFLGNNCEIDVDECASAPCQNGGKCSDSLNAFSCKCADGYEGEYCENRSDPCKSNPCRNSGICRTNITDFTCICPSGYAGKLCETEDPCVSRPCLNGATCINVGQAFTCSCIRGFTGPTCQVQINECASSPCLNNGTCVDLVNNVTCRCMEGYSGPFCEIDINECSSNPCLNNGICVDKAGSFQCTCGEFYKGTRCEILVPASSMPENPQLSTQGITATSSRTFTFSVSTTRLVHGDTNSPTASFTASTVTSPRGSNVVDRSMDIEGSLKPTPALQPSTDISMTTSIPAFTITKTAHTSPETTSMIWPTLASSWTESLATSTVWTGSVSTPEEKTAPPDSCFPLYLEGKLGSKEEDIFHEELTHMLRNYADLTGNFSVSSQFAYFKDEKGGLVTEVTPAITVDGQLLDTSKMKAICQKIPTENLFDGFSHKLYLGSRFPMSTSSAQTGHQVLGMPVIVVIVIGTAVGLLVITAVVVFVRYRRRCRLNKTATLNGDSDAFQHFENQLYMQPHTITVADRAQSVD